MLTKEHLIWCAQERIGAAREIAETTPSPAERSACEVSIALLNAALASLTAEPVGWTDEVELRDVDRGGCGYLFTCKPVTPHADERRVIKLYRLPEIE